MNNRFYALAGIAFSCVMSASVVGSTSFQAMAHDVQYAPGSVLAKDTKLADLYAQVLSTFTSIQGTAEYMRELDALARWTQLKKGKAPVKFHARLTVLAKKVSVNEWLTDEEKALFAQLIARLSKKKSRVRALSAVLGSLAAALAVAAIGGGLYWWKKKRFGGGEDGGSSEGNPMSLGSHGDDFSGGMGEGHLRPNDRAVLDAGFAVPTAPPGHNGAQLNDFPEVPTHTPTAPSAPVNSVISAPVELH